MKHFFYFLYQWLVFTPIFVVLTFLCAVIVMIMSPIFGSKFWGYHPPKWWSKFTCWLALCRITVRGREHLNPKQSYVFISNHQGAFDIFLVYGFLNQNIKWVQKQSLRKIPFVGYASEKAGHVFVDNSSTAARIATIKKAQEQITDGVSIMIFPEGSRTRTGKMARFKRGAYQIAMEMKLPIVPLTINGAYEVLRIGSLNIQMGRKMELVIHEPIPTESLTTEDLSPLITKTHEIVKGDLWEKYL